jgi:hypothetical protein
MGMVRFSLNPGTTIVSPNRVVETQAISPTQRARLRALNHDVLHFPHPEVGCVREGRKKKREEESRGRREKEGRGKRKKVLC